MTSLESLEDRIRALATERERGAAFEATILVWLTSEPELGLRRAWRWAHWPERVHRGLPASDDGIDLVAEDADGTLVAVQVKFRSDPDRAIRREEAQKALSFPDVFRRYLVVSNTWGRSKSAERALAKEQRLAWVLREELAASGFDWIGALAGEAPKPVARLQPRPHQSTAITDTIAALGESGRAQLRMACGTGKTLAALWIAEGLGIERGLVLAPTLLLLKQLRAEWLREAVAPFAALAVCSSDDVGEGGDAWELDPSDIPGEVTTDPARIADFLHRSGRRIVFSTYQSSPRIAEAQADPSIPAFDLAVADEAHKVAGVGSPRNVQQAAQRTILDGARIRADRRLFLTATPRVYRHSQRRQLEDDFGVAVYSMDDAAVFGRVAHEFGFRAAVDAKILVDYRLLITIADDAAAADAIRRRAFIDIAGRPVDANQVATAIAVRRAVEELGLRRVISFHSTVYRAKTFAGLLPDVPLDGGAPEARWISGDQPVHDREVVLSELREPAGAVVVSNARCLTEGIDVPSLDAVAFADPRRSPIDLVQAIGRAMRWAGGKTTGWVIVPVHLSPEELADPEAAVESSAFEPVVDVLRALTSHDPLIARDAARLRLALGPVSGSAPRGQGIPDAVTIDVVGASPEVLERLLASIRLRVLDVTSRGETGLQALRSFVERKGHALVPAAWEERGFQLGMWVAMRRVEYRSGRLSPALAATLEAMPRWTWDPLADEWERKLRALDPYVTRTGDARVPEGWIEGDVRLGAWVQQQRSLYRRGRLRPERATKLAIRPGWTWVPFVDAWTRALTALDAYVEKTGSARVPFGHKEGDFGLGAWVLVQRQRYRQGRLSKRRVLELDSRPGWTWEPENDRWTDGVAALRRFQARTGHVRVPRGWVEGNVQLGNWVNTRRLEYRQGRLDPARIAELDTVPGWYWEPRDRRWSAGLAFLRAYVDRHGDANVPQKGMKGSFALGSWVANRRQEHRSGTLRAEREVVLSALPGWSWNTVQDDWEAGISALRSYSHRMGGAYVPTGATDGGFEIGAWAERKRNDYRRGRLSEPRIVELKSFRGWEWDFGEARWQMRVAAVRRYVDKHGHAQISQAYVEDGVRLGRWVQHVRELHQRGDLSAKRTAQLEAIVGWTWRVG